MAWLTGWTYRKEITLSRASGAVTLYQMKLLVGESAGAVGEDVDCNEHCKTDFADLRFTKSDGTTLLDYWIESITGTTPNQLATVWIKFDSIGTGDTTFYMYYGKADASSISSIINTMIAGDDGVVGNFTEDVKGTATITHELGKYKITEDSNDDAAVAGVILADWNFMSFIMEFQHYLGIIYSGYQSFFGLFDESVVENILGAAATFGPKRRFYLARYPNDYQLGRFFVIYQNTAGTFYYWDGTYWQTTATSFPSPNEHLIIKLWSDGTNLLMDVLKASDKTSYFTNPASIAISSVKAFSSGKLLGWGDFYTNVYAFTQNIDNYFIKKYFDPEPTWGAWGSEDEEAAPPAVTIPVIMKHYRQLRS